MRKSHLLFFLIIIPFLYVSQSALAGDCIDDLDCLNDELCIDGFCEPVGDGGACIDDLDCPVDEFCDVDGFCAFDGGDGDGDGEDIGGGGCSFIPQGPASMTNYFSLGAYLLALGGFSIRRRMK